jgi:hypothetical protein
VPLDSITVLELSKDLKNCTAAVRKLSSLVTRRSKATALILFSLVIPASNALS